MATIECTARVRKDGALTIPRAARDALSLQQGEAVKVILSKPLAKRHGSTVNPLYELIPLGKKGPADGAENHDVYLYGKRPTAHLR